MARELEALGLSGMGAEMMPETGKLLDAQRAAAQNATRMSTAACHYAMAMNRSWLNFWSTHLAQFTEFPERFADAQAGFVEEAFDHYQESIQQFSGLAKQAQEEAKEAIRDAQEATEGMMRETQKAAQGMMREAQETGERATQQFREETKDLGKATRPKESRPQETAERQRGAH